VFLFLGVAGRDEAHLRPAIGPASHLGGSTRPPQRRATKRRARLAATSMANDDSDIGQEEEDAEVGYHTPTAIGTGIQSSPCGTTYTLRPLPTSTEKNLLSTVKSMETGMSEMIGILRVMAATGKANMELNSLKVQISAFPVGSAAHTRALALLEKYASES